MARNIPADEFDEFFRRSGWIPGRRISRAKWQSEAVDPAQDGELAESKDENAMKTRIGISTACVVIAIAHVIWPSVQVDLVTLALLIVGVLPWLAPVIRSVELPGGFKIELQDVKAATEKFVVAEAATPGVPAETDEKDSIEYLRGTARSDPNLALVGLRIEIERRLAQLAELADVPAGRRSAGSMLRDLAARGRIERQTASGLSDLIALGNQAAHGAMVSPNAAAWALDTAPLILETLDGLLDLRRNVQGTA